MRITVAILAALLTAGCASTCGDELNEVNDSWNQNFNAFRLPTTEEVEQFDALDEAGKLAWEEAGKPMLKPIDPVVLEIISEMYKANQELASAHNDGAANTTPDAEAGLEGEPEGEPEGVEHASEPAVEPDAAGTEASTEAGDEADGS